MQRTVEVTLRGTSPLLMNRFPTEGVEKNFDKRPAEEQAEKATYRNGDGKLYMPAVNLYRGLISAGAFSKWKGKSTCWRPVASSFHVAPAEIIFDNQKYTVLSLPIKNQTTGGRVLKHRPMIDPWSLSFDLSWEEGLLSESQVKEIVTNLCTLVGIGDYRPENAGPYGRCEVVKWKVKKA